MWFILIPHSHLLHFIDFVYFMITRSTLRVETLAKTAHCSHIAQCKHVEPWRWKAYPKGSGSLPEPRSGHSTAILVYFAHLLILEDLDHHQNLISSSLFYPGPPIKFHPNPFIAFWVMLSTNSRPVARLFWCVCVIPPGYGPEQTDKPMLPKS